MTKNRSRNRQLRGGNNNQCAQMLRLQKIQKVRERIRKLYQHLFRAGKLRIKKKHKGAMSDTLTRFTQEYRDVFQAEKNISKNIAERRPLQVPRLLRLKEDAVVDAVKLCSTAGVCHHSLHPAVKVIMDRIVEEANKKASSSSVEPLTSKTAEIDRS